MAFVIVSFFILFLSSLGILVMLKMWYRGRQGMSLAKLKVKLQDHSMPSFEEKNVSMISPPKVLSGVPALQKILARAVWVPRLDRLIEQANVYQPVGVILLSILLLASIGFLVGTFFGLGWVMSVLMTVVLGYLPIYVLKFMKRRRLATFQKQLPEALDLIGRALRAGHPFATGMKLSAENFKKPLGEEFMKTVGEINFGTSVPDALKNLVGRVDCPDLKFFVVAVILQRETGGNLAEIMESMARIIRERFAFAEKVHALTGEGRISAKIIAGIVVFIILSIRTMKPDFYDGFLQDPTGRILAFGAAGSVLLGLYVMKRMTDGIKM